MKNTFWYKSALLTLMAGPFLAGCVTRERVVYRQPPPAQVTTTDTVGGEVVVTEAPPVAEVETITVSPGPGFVWVPGAYVWRGHWVWARGRWAHPPRAGAVWVPHRYEVRGGVQVFVHGGWRY